MNGKLLAALGALAVLVLFTVDLRSHLARLEASRVLHEAEVLTMGALGAGQVPRVLMQQNIRNLRRAAELDPQEVGVRIALGTQYLLLRSAQAAEAAYREGLEIEPRPELYLNLGKAQQMGGDYAGARESYAKALAIAPHLAPEVPPLPEPLPPDS